MKSGLLQQFLYCLLFLVLMLGLGCDVKTCFVPPPSQRLRQNIPSDLQLSACTGSYQVSAIDESAEPLANTSSYDAFGVLLQLPSGRMLSIYRQAETNDSDRGVIVERTSDDEGVHWSAARLLFENPVMDSRNVAGGVLPSGTAIVFWNTFDFRAFTPLLSQLFYSRSTDGGKTWSEPKVIPGVQYAYGPLLITPDRIAMCFSRADSGGNKAHVYLYFSFDGGITWTCHRAVANSQFSSLPTPEDAFVWLGGDKILGFGRNRLDRPLLRFYSADMGAHWDIQETDLGADTTPNIGWRVISPWIVKPSPQLPQVQVWWGERILLSHTSQRGDIDSLLVNSAQAISTPQTLRKGTVVFSAPTFSLGYPSVALTGDGGFLTQFYAMRHGPPDLFLLPGTFTAQCGS